MCLNMKGLGTAVRQNNLSFYSITKYVNLRKGDSGQVKPNSCFAFILAGSKDFYIQNNINISDLKNIDYTPQL